MAQETTAEIKPAEIQLDDYEAQPRKLTFKMEFFVGIVAVTLSLFQLYTAWVGPFYNLIQRPIHLAFVFVILFATYPAMKKSVKKDQILWSDWILIALSVVCTLWVIIYGNRFLENPGESTSLDLIWGAVMTLIVLEGARRVLGPVLPIMTTLTILYALFGNYIPGEFGHSGFSLQLVIENIYTSSLGLWGLITGISASLIAGFLIFGVMLQKTGGGETFVDLALRIAGRSHGGPAKVSCFSSAFFGTISGSAIANVVVDGVFNIPLMKSLGYKKEFAGAVEATASTGGQIMPPVMGAGAFIMAELLGIPYARVAAGAAIPAILFYLGIYCSVHFEAQRLHLKPLTADMIPSFRKKILPRSLPFFLPASVLVYLLSIGYNAALSSFYAVVISIGWHLISARNKETLKKRVKEIISALDGGGRTIVMVAALCACAQMLIGCLI
jgi:TRAP transporter 4TM/12TM fusion protein